MKKILVCLLCGTILLTFTACVSGGKTAEISYIAAGTTENDPLSTEFSNVYTDGAVTLQINPDTTDIRVLNRETGAIWSTANRDEGDDSVYNQIYLSYRTDSGGVGTLSSVFDSISDGQYQIEYLENGVKVRYTLGKVAVEYLYPTSLTPERYEYFYNRCNEEDKAVLELIYTLIDISFYDDITQQELREKYPNASEGMIYGLRNTMNDALKAEISQVFKRLGYTQEDLETDNTEYEGGSQQNAVFNISVYYTLENGDLIVCVPASEIECDPSIHIETMNLLECFSASEQSEGYFVLPDGSGSVMEFRNGKENQTAYRTEVYGTDNTKIKDSKVLNAAVASLPVYGCVSGDSAYLAVLEQGETHMSINAFTGTSSLTPRAWVDIAVEEKDYMIAQSNTTTGKDDKLSVYQSERYKEDYRIRYHFFSGADADYSAMSAYYGEYLLGDSSVKRNAYPLVTEIIGAVTVTEKLLGIEKSKIHSLTTFEQAQSIAEDLLQSDIETLILRYSGWFGAGYYNGLVNSPKPLSILGGDDGMAKLIAASEKIKIPVYLDADVQYAYRSNIGMFQKNKQYSARFLDESVALLPEYDTAVFTALPKGTGNERYVLTPDSVSSAISQLISTAKQWNCGVSYRKLGIDLNSDYNVKNTVDRQDSLKTIRETLLSSRDTDISVMITGCNAYAITGADYAAGIDTKSNGQDMTDYSIPFVPMVLSGRIGYCSYPLNTYGGERTDLLRIIESNAAPSVLLTEDDCKSINVGNDSFFCSTAYDVHKQSLIQSYRYLYEAVGDTYGQKITDHIRLAPGVFKTVFSSGKWVIVNYTERDFNDGGATVAAKDYLRGKG